MDFKIENLLKKEKNTKLTFPIKIKNTLLSLKNMIDCRQEIDEKTELKSYLNYVCIVKKGIKMF